LFADDTCVSPVKRRCSMSDAMLHGGSSFVVQRGRDWMYFVDGSGQLRADWDAADIDAWREHMPWEEKDDERINTLLGKVVCTTGCALRVVASVAVDELIKEVHPRCTLWSESTFSHSIIPALARIARDWCKQQLSNAKFVTVLTDLWTAAKGRSVCAYLAVTDQREVVIVHAPERTGVRHDAEMIAQDTQDVIAMVDAVAVSSSTSSLPPDSTVARRSKVVAVVTDAASCNIKARSQVLPQYPGLRWETCNAHHMNNLLKGLGRFVTYEKLCKDARGVVAAVKNN